MKKSKKPKADMPTTVILADYASESEYHAIKDQHGDPFPSLELHRKALAGAEVQLRMQGYKVLREICDLEGYRAFCRRNEALNTPQTVSAYVSLKHDGKEMEPHPELRHQYITVHK